MNKDDQKRAMILRGIERYARQRLGPLLGEPGPLEISPVGPEKIPESYLVVAPSGQKYLLRSFVRRPDYRRYRANLDRTCNADLPLPGYIASDRRLTTILRYPGMFTVEQWIEGADWDDSGKTDTSAEEVMRALARLHEDTSPQWGSLDRLSRDSFSESFAIEMDRMFDEIVMLSPGRSMSELGFWQSWFSAEADSMPVPSRFNLIHGNLRGSSIRLLPDGGVCFLNPRLLRYDVWVDDVEEALQILAGWDEARRGQLLECYLGARHQATMESDPADFAMPYRLRHLLRNLLKALREQEAKPPSDPAGIEQLRVGIRKLIR